MMAKKKTERYNDAKELLIDLEAVRDGLPPLRARQKFDIGSLRQLEQGLAVDEEPVDDNLYSEDIITRYRVGLVILTALVAVLLLVLAFMAMGD